MKKVISLTMALAISLMVLMATSNSTLASVRGDEALTSTDLSSSESSSIVVHSEDDSEDSTEDDTTGGES